MATVLCFTVLNAMSDNKFDSIRPYSDEEAVKALRRLSHNPFVPIASKFLFPDEPFYRLSRMFRKVTSIEDFQRNVVSRVVEGVLKRTSSGFSCDGLENLKPGKTFVAISNHRDISLDAALTQWALYSHGLPMMEVCIGSNLMDDNRTASTLLRSVRMVRVVRGLPAREMYESSKLLSEYIRDAVSTSRSSIWVAQKEGRAKNGLDKTAHGLVKMLDMSGMKGFYDNFSELNITPMSISYEYEPCDILKARELLIASGGKYVKKRGEDTRSILDGIRLWKGGIHLSVCRPLSENELRMASVCERAERYQTVRTLIDGRIVDAYKLWNTNYIGYDLMTGGDKYASLYSDAERMAFIEYAEKRLDSVEHNLDRDALRKIFYQIYGNPVLAREQL